MPPDTFTHLLTQPRPRTELLQAAADALGVTYEWLSGSTADPSIEGLLQTREELWKALDDLDEELEREWEASNAVPEFKELNFAARAAFRDVLWAIFLKTPEGEHRDTVAEDLGKGLAAMFQFLEVDLGSVPEDDLSDYVILGCQATKALYRR